MQQKILKHHSIVENVKKRKPISKTTLEGYIKVCQNGEFKEKVLKVREHHLAGEKNEVDKIKVSMPCIIVGGVAAGYVNDDNIVQYSHTVCIDMDNISRQGVDIDQFRKKIEADLYCRACVKSIKGDGLAAFVEVDSSMKNHKSVSEQIIDYFSNKYNIEVDAGPSKILSACRLVTYDPDAYYSDGSEVWHFIDPETQAIIDKQSEFAANVTDFKEGSRNSDLFIWGNRQNEAGVPIVDATAQAIREFAEDDFRPDEIRRTIQSAYKNFEDHGKVQELFEGSGGTKGNEGKGGTQDKSNGENTKGSHTTTAAAASVNTNCWVNAPLIPDDAIPKLKLVEETLKVCKNAKEKSIALLTLLTIVSACLPKVSFIYSKRHFSNLFIIILAGAGEGKGLVDKIKGIGNALDTHLREACENDWSQYEKKKQSCEGNEECTEPPVRPECSGLNIPDDTSTAAFQDCISNRQKTNLLVSTEIDTLNRTGQGDHFEKSDLYRKLFHHETIHKARKSDDHPIIIDDPACSILLSGTPGAVSRFIPMVEDGTTSRFSYFGFGSGEYKWESQQGEAVKNHIENIESAGNQLIEIHEFNDVYPFQFEFTDKQMKEFDAQFEEWTAELDLGEDDDYFASLKRLGVTIKRIACTLTAIWRYENSIDNETTYCPEDLFESAMAIGAVLKEHNRIMYDQMVSTKPSKPTQPKDQFIDNLPDGFTTQDAYDAGEKLGYSRRWVRNILSSWVGSKVTRLKPGLYKKATAASLLFTNFLNII